MNDNPHFRTVADWKEARPMLAFEPLPLTDDSGRPPQSLSIFVMDHKMRQVPIIDRTLEAHFEDFMFHQSMKPDGKARAAVIEISYGVEAKAALVGGHEARSYDHGPEPEPDDIDPQLPAVVVWYLRDRFFMLASATMSVEALIALGTSLYDRGPVR